MPGVPSRFEIAAILGTHRRSRFLFYQKKSKKTGAFPKNMRLATASVAGIDKE
jgi:hypothetical protein